MKIWIDFINSPQVSFFEPLINELSKDGHEFVLTCRDSSNTTQLISQRKWSYTVIGKKVEKSVFKKLLGFPLRIWSLFSFLKDKKPDVSICQSSFYLPLTARLLGIPSIYTNDNEHALGNIPAFLFATQILVPEGLPLKKIKRLGAKSSKVIRYPGIKEGIYLWIKGLQIQKQRRLKKSAFTNIYVRPEPITAQYYSGKSNFLDQVLIRLKDKYPITIFVRDDSQYEYYSQSRFSGISVPTTLLSFEEIASECLLFIGAGGTMTREMAMMGIPTISVYDGDLLDVDKFLISENLLTHQPDIKVSFVEDFMIKIKHSQINNSLLNKGQAAYQLFKDSLLAYSI
jgi:uncharacterized protein